MLLKMKTNGCYFLSLISLARTPWAAQPSAPASVAAPLRDLPWGDLNFLHSTDTHGWIAGHLSEPQYSADWGDYVSFTEHLRKKAEDEGRDLLVIDTGDRVEGNGLYDASHPKGNFSRDIFGQQDVDIICIGNHELYKNSTAESELLDVVPRYADNYLASNVDVIDPKDGKRIPLAKRFSKFETKKRKIRVVAFGFLYNFEDNDGNSFVQKVEDTVAEDWFQNAVKDQEVDLFLVAGHIPAHSDEFSTLHKAIRAKQWDVPIMFFGGHRHIRDYAIYDDKTHAIASGRYLETIGFQSISGLSSASNEKARLAATPAFKRRFVDNNLYSYHHHSGLNASTFPTERGRNTTNMIASARKTLGLDRHLGCAPKDLWITRAEYPSDNSLYSWLESSVIPQKVIHDERAAVPRIIISNTGAMRFDIFQGAVTLDTLYSVSPFTNGFRYIQDVPFDIANRVLTVLNEGPELLQDISSSLSVEMPAQLIDVSPWHARPVDTFANVLDFGDQSVLQAKPKLIPGYTTTDDAGNDGDDTIHSPFVEYKIPLCFEARVNTTAQHVQEATEQVVDKVDLVFVSFIEPWLLAALTFLGGDYSSKDVFEYTGGKHFTILIKEWIQENWNGTC